MLATSTARLASSLSAMRPASGAARRRMAVPAASTTPIASGSSPRALRNEGKNGEWTPKAA
jgi:hypothetical protein